MYVMKSGLSAIATQVSTFIILVCFILEDKGIWVTIPDYRFMVDWRQTSILCETPWIKNTFFLHDYTFACLLVLLIYSFSSTINALPVMNYKKNVPAFVCLNEFVSVFIKVVLMLFYRHCYSLVWWFHWPTRFKSMSS